MGAACGRHKHDHGANGQGGHGHDHGDVAVFAGKDPAFRRVLWLVIVLNAGMAAVEIAAGSIGDSMALQADALDFIGDAASYGLSLAAIGWTLVWRARAALLKAASLAAFAVFVLAASLYRFAVLSDPSAEVMGVVGFAALAVNLLSVLLLMRWRDGDSNVRSVWLCSRNDAIGNVAVLAAAVLVGWTATPWPDLVVAIGMASLFAWSSVAILRQARAELRVAVKRS